MFEQEFEDPPNSTVGRPVYRADGVRLYGFGNIS